LKFPLIPLKNITLILNMRALKKILLMLAFITLCQTSYSSQNFTPANIKSGQYAIEDIIIETAQSRLPEHEKLTYSVRWLGIPVGTITASIKGIKAINGRMAYQLEVTAKTNAFCSAIYRIDDKFVSYMDTENFYTLRHEVYRREGRYQKDAITDFDHENKKAYYQHLPGDSIKTIDVPYGVQDTLSACYYFRLLSLGIGDKIEYSVYNNEKIYQLFGIIEAKDYIRVPILGRKAAFYVQPYAQIEGEQVKKGRVGGYFSADSKRIPLLIAVQAPMFTEITASLDSIDYGQSGKY
jgi:hypothetical protein